MTIGVAGGGSRSNSRASRTGRYSTSRLRNSQHGSAAAGGGSSLGGQPLNSPGSGAGKNDIKHRFEIIRKLGSGTYGKVSLAYDHKNDREVAVKLIKKSAIENKQDLVRIRREIRIMSALKHPNIIQIFEVFENRDKIILVMEYASGGELYDYVSTYGSLAEPEARRLFRQITSAVLYCHKHKVAHRDLKLENILLDANNNAKIADFGLSNYFSDKNLLSTFCGSPLYASPEIINGTPYRGPEVDCWSLGILLYTLVYGSMPFDGRDFNRMVRQIKRGAYFEPDTPSTASMLIRNMLRVNPERRADIDDIASHWWLNLEENMPVIQELPENQIVDFTPLTERAETMVVQDLADEADVFMDFGHLSATTRKKIEEFRRRRKEAEEYNENSPIKPPKTRKTEEGVTEMLSTEKSLRHDVVPKKDESPHEDLKDGFSDPLERLKRLESRLQTTGSRENRSPDRTPLTTSAHKDRDVYRSRQPTVNDGPPFSRTAEQKPLEVSWSRDHNNTHTVPEQPDDPTTSNSRISEKSSIRTGEDRRIPSFIALDSPSSRVASGSKSANTWRVETDSLNMLMNQVLEQMDTGPVSMNLVARIKAHALYDTRPMVKELLESIIAAQPPSVQRHASKIIQQQSQKRLETEKGGAAAMSASQRQEMTGSPSKKYQVADVPQRPSSKPQQKPALEERPWHSVEVGFDPDEEPEHMDTCISPSLRSNVTEETVPDTSFEDEIDDKTTASEGKSLASKRGVLTKKDTIEEVEELEEEGVEDEGSEFEEEEDEDEEEYNTDIDELGDEVEQVEEEEDNVSYASAVSQQANEHLNENVPPPDPQTHGIPPKFVDSFDRCLAKRQSKGKYQHNKVEMYGRGVSMECESPTFSHRRIGGPQPTIERSPFLFDKAKKYIMTYPKQVEESDEEEVLGRSKGKAGELKKNWLRTQDPDVMGSSMENASQSATPTASRVGSVPPRSPPKTTKSEDEEASESEEEEDEEEEEGEEEEESEEEEEEEEKHDDGSTRRPSESASARTAATFTFPPSKTQTSEPTSVVSIVLKTTPSTKHGSASSWMQSAPASIHNSPSPEAQTADSGRSTTNTNYYQIDVPPRPKYSVPAAFEFRKNSQPSMTVKSTGVESRTVADIQRRGSGALSRSPSPPHQTNDESADNEADGRGMQSWETAASYIRRKNRERRQRNRTVATSEDLLRSAAEYRDSIAAAYAANDYTNASSGRAQSPTNALVGRGAGAADAFYTRPSVTGNSQDQSVSGALFPYVRPRYHDDSYRRKESDTDNPMPTAHFNSNLQSYALRDEHAKSRSVHDLSPDRPEMSVYRPATTASKYSSGASPSYTSTRHDNEQLQPAVLHNWAHEPRKFQVYQTRAEREAEKNTGVANLHPSSTYRTTGSRYGALADRPSSVYAPSYASRFDDNFSYRRSAYDVQREGANAPGAETTSTGTQPGGMSAQVNHDQPSGVAGMLSRFRPVTRRVASSANPDPLNSTRSQSMDRKGSGQEDADVVMRSRLLSPEASMDRNEYSYVNYHDTSARESAPREPEHGRVPSRGILKNKQSADLEPRATGASTSENGRGMVGGKDQSTAASGVKNMLDRLKRHLSTEKSASPAPTGGVATQERASSVGFRHRFGSGAGLGTTSHNPSLTMPGRASIASNIEEEKAMPSKADSKKRSLLSLGRRRTTEMRLGADGKIITAGYEDDAKRPSSPIEKIKSLFRKTKESSATPSLSTQPTSTYDYSHYTAVPTSTMPNRYGVTDKVYGVHPSSHLSTMTPREPYMPQYRKYTGGSNGINFNRYSYTPGTSGDRAGRHWYEDSHLY